MAQGRNNAFRLSGNIDLPVYVGFIVILIQHVGIRIYSSVSKKNIFFLSLMAAWIVVIYDAITDNTSKSILLNSSKQHQAPQLAKPLKNLLIDK